MKLLIFGATGKSGRPLVRQALDAGHQVTAFVRDPSRLKLKHPALSAHVGDVTNYGDVVGSVGGHDAVMCTLGAPPSDRNGVRALGTANILAAMVERQVERFVCQTVFGIGDTRSGLPAYLRWLIIPFWLEHAYADHEGQEQRILTSDVAWTIVRPPFLTDGPAVGTYQHGAEPVTDGIRLKVSRADVANFLLRQAQDDRYVRRSVWISD